MNEKCGQCIYFHGKAYNEVWFNCAPHPSGIEGDCPHFEQRPYKKQKPNLIFVLDEYTTTITPSMVYAFRNRFNRATEATNSSFNFLDGCCTNSKARNLTINMLEAIYDCKLNLLQRRSFKKVLKQSGSFNSEQVIIHFLKHIQN